MGGQGITCGDVGTDGVLLVAMTYSLFSGLSGLGMKITDAKLSSDSMLVSLCRLSFDESGKFKTFYISFECFFFVFSN